MMSYAAVGFIEAPAWLSDAAGELVRRVTGGEPEPKPFSPDVAEGLCRIDPSFQQLTVIVQGTLMKRGARIPAASMGKWDAATCKAWWKVTGEPLTPAALRKLLPDVAGRCPDVNIHVDCPKPMPWGLIGGALLLTGAATVVYVRRRR